MSINYTSLPGITKIYSLPCATLPRYMVEKYACHLPIAVLSTKEQVQFVGVPTCKRSTEAQNNGKSVTVELQFTVPGHYTAPKVATAFVVVTASGDAYAIGLRESPFPSVTVEETTGTPSGDPNQTTVTVKHSSVESLIPVVI